MIAIYIFGGLLVVLLTGVMLAPLVEREPPDVPLEELPAKERRAVALEALRELEFEHETGKLTDEEYGRQRARYGRAALDALEEMESSGGEGAAPVEAEEASGGAAGEDVADSGDATEPGEQEARTRCPSCGSAVRSDASFCAQCGSPLAASAGESA